MFKMIRYIKIFIKFPDNITAFWDDNHYIMYVDPHIRGKFQVWQNLEARGKYYPRGTNVLLCTVIGGFYDLVSTWSKEKVMQAEFSTGFLGELGKDSEQKKSDFCRLSIDPSLPTPFLLSKAEE